MKKFETSTETLAVLQSVVDEFTEEGIVIGESDYACALFRLADVQLSDEYEHGGRETILACGPNRVRLKELAVKAGVDWI